MLIWFNPVYDRTQEDVDYAKTKITEWINNPTSIVYDLKGCLNVSDINRIEGNIEYLSKNLLELGYNTNVSTKTWDNIGLINQRDVNRILNNINDLKTSFYTHNQAPLLPSDMLDYNSINDIEKNLYLIKELLDCMVNSLHKSNTFKSGQSTFLPIRRY